jgi:ATP dependent DNA ligase domain
LRERALDGAGWLHEIKLDGYRAQVHIHRGRVTIYSRSGYNWTDHFHQIAHGVKALSEHDLVIDGEATVFGNTGLPDFQALRRELAKKHSARLVYLAFDLLYLDGYDLRSAPLIERKRALQELLAKAPPNIHYVEHFEMDDGEAVVTPASSNSKGPDFSGWSKWTRWSCIPGRRSSMISNMRTCRRPVFNSTWSRRIGHDCLEYRSIHSSRLNSLGTST